MTEEEEAAMRPKIGDRKVTENELDTIVSRLIRPQMQVSTFYVYNAKEL